MDAVSHEQLRAEEDARLLANLNRWAYTPTERQRLLEIRDAKRASKKRKDVAIVAEITRFFGDGGAWTAADR